MSSFDRAILCYRQALKEKQDSLKENEGDGSHSSQSREDIRMRIGTGFCGWCGTSGKMIVIEMNGESLPNGGYKTTSVKHSYQQDCWHCKGTGTDGYETLAERLLTLREMYV